MRPTILLVLSAALLLPASLIAQDDSQGAAHHDGNDHPDTHHKPYPHFKVIDTGSFGGPNSHIHLGAHVLNDAGVLTVSADLPDTDPYSPDGCFNGDCLVTHTAKWKEGELKDLGVIGAGPNSESNWLSDNGIIAGDSQNGLLDPLVGSWELRGVVWTHNKLIEVGTLSGGYNSLAWAVNDSGEVVGFSTTTVPDDNAMILQLGLPYAFQTRAFRWSGGRIEDLGTLGGSDAMALGINERGQIIGNSYTSFDKSAVCRSLTTGAFLWEHGKMTNLGSLGGTCTQVSAINNRGQVVGSSFLAGDQVLHPFLWERGRLVDLGTLGGNFASANFVNEAGDIAGVQSEAGNDDIIHATVWSRGRIFDLGAPGPGQCSDAWGINAHSQVVGLISSDCNFGDELSLRAFLWEPGHPMVDLNTLISPGLGIQLRNIATINDRGEMAAVAAFANGDRRPVILVPCDDHDGNDADCRDEVPLNSGTVTRESNGSRPFAIPPAKKNSSSAAAQIQMLLSHRRFGWSVDR
jgi:probable HAF family extracellular repeat protein